MSTSTTVRQRPLDEQARDGAKSEPMLAGAKSPAEMFLVKLFAIVPAVALAAAVPLVWGWGLGWADIGLAVFCYTVTCLGVSAGPDQNGWHANSRQPPNTHDGVPA